MKASNRKTRSDKFPFTLPSSDLTNKVYTNVDPVLRQAVDLIPAGEWL